ncbi:hypothetical protein DFH09DRAFT_1345785 [Mycena vulgaris]|nr:hypothetical protein DFH09DRAFT_1345785 [Mycena vulgaris]
MCFANAVLQALVHCPPFAALVARPPGAGGLLGATGAFVREFVVQKAEGKGDAKGKGEGKGKGRAQEEEEEGEAFVATGVYDALKGSKRFDHMRGGQQEDAEEFLGFFLDTLEEELLALAPAVAPPPTPAPAVVEAEEPPEAQDGWLEVGRKNRAVVTRTIKEAESPISRIFGGKFRSTLRAAGQKDSAIIEAWRALRLDIQRDAIHTIQDALSFIAHPQVVQMGAADASLQILIAALPPVLVLHVKRFYYDAAAGVVKLAKRVTFGPELEIGGDVLAPTATTTGRKPVRYKLFAAVYHHGVSAAGGHYTLDVLHATRGWVRIDDELVSDVRAEDVFGVEREREEGRNAIMFSRARKVTISGGTFTIKSQVGDPTLPTRVAYWERHVARLEARLEELEASVDLRNMTSFPDTTSLESSDLTAICDRRGMSPWMVVTVVATSARAASQHCPLLPPNFELKEENLMKPIPVLA